MRFHVDIGLGDVVVGEPDWVEGRPWLSFVAIPPARVALYPLPQQFAEKVHAYTFPWQDRDNTRVKDLVDLVLLLTSGSLVPDCVKIALQATFLARGTHPLPERLPAPPSDWAEPYAALAQSSTARTYAGRRLHIRRLCLAGMGTGPGRQPDCRRIGVMRKADLSAAIKRARDIMRKDAGLNGDLDRIPQLSWILFLKCFDDMEQRREVTEKKYRPAIESPYRWRDWAARSG